MRAAGADDSLASNRINLFASVTLEIRSVVMQGLPRQQWEGIPQAGRPWWPAETKCGSREVFSSFCYAAQPLLRNRVL